MNNRELLIREVKATIEQFNKNPLHYMSLGSKELFHSNVWAWMFIYDKNIINYFLDSVCVGKKINPDEELTILREESKIDLSIKLSSGKKIIFENKFKSIPTKEQLDRYQDKLNEEIEFGVLTGIIKPSFFKDSKKVGVWTFLSYKDIGENLLKYVKAQNKISKEIQLIEAYAVYIIELYNLLKKVDNIYCNEMINSDELIECLEKGKLADLCKKINIERFKDYLTACLSEDIEISTGFYRKSAEISCRYNKFLENGVKYVIGIQIQNGQFRRTFGIASKEIKKDNSLKTQLDALIKSGWFEDIANDSKMIFGKSTTQKHQFNTFSVANEYVMKYQHYIIEDYSFDGLYKIIAEDMGKAIKILKTSTF